MTKNKSNLEINWLNKSLENLEKDSWKKALEDESYLVTTCYKLRKKQLKEFDTEDLRIMIGQNIGLKYLIPLALEVLEKNILDEGHLYEGDLLKSVLTSNKEYWKNEVDNWDKMREIFNHNINKIEKEAAQYSTGKKIIIAFKEFDKIN